MLHCKLLLFLKLTVLVFWLLIKVVLVPKRRLTLSCILLFFSTYLQPWRGFNRSRYLDLFLKGFSQTINLIQNKYFKKYLKILNCQIITKDLSWCKRWNRFPKMILKGIVWKFITFLWSICPQTLVHTSMYMFSVFIGICEQSRYIFCSTFYVLRSSIDSITSWRVHHHHISLACHSQIPLPSHSTNKHDRFALNLHGRIQDFS